MAEQGSVSVASTIACSSSGVTSTEACLDVLNECVHDMNPRAARERRARRHMEWSARDKKVDSKIAGVVESYFPERREAT